MKRTLTMSCVERFGFRMWFCEFEHCSLPNLVMAPKWCRIIRGIGSRVRKVRIASLHQDAFATLQSSSTPTPIPRSTNSSSSTSDADFASDANSESDLKPVSEPNSEFVVGPEP